MEAVVASVEDPRCAVNDIPDDLLRLILLRLDSPICLMRAACACKRWRRVVVTAGGGADDDEGRAFLRLASSIHLPTVVGQYHHSKYNKMSMKIRFVPSSSSSSSSHIIDGCSRFSSVDFLVKNKRWHVADCHGGLVLLCKASVPDTMILYDPLTRQHRPIPLPPPPPPPNQQSSYCIKDTFLLDNNDGSRSSVSISNFRVLYWFDNAADGDAVACVFSSTANGGDQWEWRFVSGLADEYDDVYLRHCFGSVAGRAHDGSVYLGLDVAATGLDSSRVIALDTTSLLFSRVNLPSRLLMDTQISLGSSTFSLVVVKAAANDGVVVGRPTTSIIVHVRGEELELFRQVHGSGEWVLEHSIPSLSVLTRGLSICLEKKNMMWNTMVGVVADDGAAIAILSASSSDSYTTNARRWFFSLDVNTMQMRVLPKRLYRGTWKILNYTLPWPQFLRACPCS